MKKSALTIMALLSIVFFTACGSDCGSDPLAPVANSVPPDRPAIYSNTVDFSCISVDNDQVCTGMEDSPGIWNSGPVQTTGSPMPVDFLNLEITNNSLINTSVFAYSMVTITGCGDNPIAFDVVDLVPGETAVFSYTTYNVRCGVLGYQETMVSLYNATGFDPALYPNPWTYPRIDLILNAMVRWENRIPGDMP